MSKNSELFITNASRYKLGTVIVLFRHDGTQEYGHISGFTLNSVEEIILVLNVLGKTEYAHPSRVTIV